MTLSASILVESAKQCMLSKLLPSYCKTQLTRFRPKVQCFPHPIEQQIFRANTVFEQGFSVSSNLSDPKTRDHLIEQQRQFLAMKKTQAELCAQSMAEVLPYMGTATVVRDIFLMTSKLDDEHALMQAVK